MQREGSLYTFGFAAAVCFVCSALVCSAAVLLKERQEMNKKLDRQRNVLAVAGLVEEGTSVSSAELLRRFEESISPRLVDLRTGKFAENPPVNVADYDQRRARDDADLSAAAPANLALVERVPHYALAYLVMDGGKMQRLILPVEGMGLWSTLYAYLALDRDMRTIRGITFYEHGETPGLGGEVENPRWRERWKGRLAYDENGRPKIEVIKGPAGSVEEDPYRVDGIAGATITSRGVSNMLQFWLGENGFGPLVAKLRETEE